MNTGITDVHDARDQNVIDVRNQNFDGIRFYVE
jgi:hypothetical protein